MNLIADRLEEYLTSSGICCYRNSPEMTVNQITADSNSKNPVLHFALHSNAAPEALSGQLMGTDVYYYPGSVQGKKLAEIVADNFKSIYPYPDKVQTRTSGTLAELRYTKAPSVLVEIAYHDNEEDAAWIKSNIDAIAKNFAQSIEEYLDAETNGGIPAQVSTMGSRLNMRSSPSLFAPIIMKIPNGSTVNVLERNGHWYKISYMGQRGYVSRRYLSFP